MKKILSYFTILLTAFIVASFSLPTEKKELVTSKYYCAPNSLADIQAIADGPWNSASTWSTNQIPTSADDVTIPTGIRVTLSGTMNAKTIGINGTLSPFNLTTDFDLTTKGIMVHNGGLLQIGSEANSYTANGSITLTGSNPNEVLFGKEAVTELPRIARSWISKLPQTTTEQV